MVMFILKKIIMPLKRPILFLKRRLKHQYPFLVTALLITCIAIFESLRKLFFSFSLPALFRLILILFLNLFLTSSLFYFLERKQLLKGKRALFTLLTIYCLSTVLFKITYVYMGIYSIPFFWFMGLINVLFPFEVSFISNLFLAFIVTMATNSEFLTFVYFFLIGTVSIWTTLHVMTRMDITKASFYVSAVMALLITVDYSFKNSFVAVEYIRSLLIGISNPVISSILLIGTLPYFESASRLVSNIGLIELANLNHPLLKRLSMEAPGTYYHSILISNLAESAASRIGANSLLARVASYYHDIGKLKRPNFFIENQLAEENPHDNITPKLSYMAIVSHVKDGIELAREYRLPGVIEDIIREHHGNRVIKYFYHKALSSTKSGEKVDIYEDDFRYEGPKPRSKESGIIMLADAVEAASKSLKNPSPQRIRTLIEDITNTILNEHQLSDSGLTLRDIENIVEEFTRVFAAMMHARVEYPKETAKEGLKIGGKDKKG